MEAISSDYQPKLSFWPIILPVKSLYYLFYPKFWDREACANSVDPDQTAPKEQSDQGLHCLSFSVSIFDLKTNCIQL